MRWFPSSTSLSGPRANRRGCFIMLIVLAIALAAIAFIGFNAPPEPSGDIPTM